MRNQVCSELVKAKRGYINSQIDTVHGVKYWRIINDNFFRIESPKIDHVFKNNTDEMLCGKPAADEVNNYFCNISTELSVKFGPIQETPLIFSDHPDYFVRKDISIHSVKEHINAIDSKSSGLNEINAWLLKLALKNVPSFFCNLLNRCVEKCIFQDSWKTGMVIILPKKGNPRLLNNMRPISLLPDLGKIMEYFINHEFVCHLEKNNLLCDQQMGFRL